MLKIHSVRCAKTKSEQTLAELEHPAQFFCLLRVKKSTAGNNQCHFQLVRMDWGKGKLKETDSNSRAATSKNSNLCP